MNEHHVALPDITDTAWRSSSFSGGQSECLQVADGIPGLVPVRDSKRPTGPVISFGRGAWRAFLARLG
jgi:hypothetical protein